MNSVAKYQSSGKATQTARARARRATGTTTATPNNMTIQAPLGKLVFMPLRAPRTRTGVARCKPHWLPRFPLHCRHPNARPFNAPARREVPAATERLAWQSGECEHRIRHGTLPAARRWGVGWLAAGSVAGARCAIRLSQPPPALARGWRWLGLIVASNKLERPPSEEDVHETHAHHRHSLGKSRGRMTYFHSATCASSFGIACPAVPSRAPAGFYCATRIDCNIPSIRVERFFASTTPDRKRMMVLSLESRVQRRALTGGGEGNETGNGASC